MLRVMDLEVTYHSVAQVLYGVDLIVPEGQIVALLGTNGAGKTTLLRSITGLLPIHHGQIPNGQVQWHNEPLHSLPAEKIVKKGIVQVMEGRRVFQELTVEENLKVGSYVRRDKKVTYDIEFYKTTFPAIAQNFKKQAGFLSGGEQQILAICRALMANPKLLLLDEPSLGLAPKIVSEIMQLIQQVKAQGITVLLVEQNATAALSVADYAYILESGNIVHEGTPADLKNNETVREFYLGLSGSGTQSFAEGKSYKKRKTWVQ